MKKLFAITLLLIYSFSTTGMSFSIHYCCGKLKSIDWTLPEKKCCDDQQKMGGKPCCETKLIGNKKKSDQNLARLIVTPPATAIVDPGSFTDIKVLSGSNQKTPVIFTPPPLSALPLFIRHQVFRI